MVVCVELSHGLPVKTLLGAAGILLLLRFSGFSTAIGTKAQYSKILQSVKYLEGVVRNSR